MDIEARLRRTANELIAEIDALGPDADELNIAWKSGCAYACAAALEDLELGVRLNEAVRSALERLG